MSHPKQPWAGAFLPAHTALQLAAAPGGALTLWTAAVNARVFDERFRLPARAAPAEAAAAPAVAVAQGLKKSPSGRARRRAAACAAPGRCRAAGCAAAPGEPQAPCGLWVRAASARPL